MNDAKKYISLSIRAAQGGGHFVYEEEGKANHGMYRPILFAGTLDQCLTWIMANIHHDA